MTTTTSRAARLFGILSCAVALGCANPLGGDPSDGAANHSDGRVVDLGAAARDAATVDLASAVDRGALADLSAASDDLATPPDLAPPLDLVTPPDLTPDNTCPTLNGKCQGPLCAAACATCNKIGVCSNQVCVCF